MQTYRDYMTKVVISMLEDYYYHKWKLDGDFATFAKANVYRQSVVLQNSNPNSTLMRYRKLHYPFLQNLVGPHVGRRELIQPMGFAFVDFEGSRSGSSSSMELPHIHTICCIHPDTKDRFDQISLEEPIFEGAQLFDPDIAPFDEFVSYALKGCFGVTGPYPSRGDLWGAFPFITKKSKFKGGRQL